ncbi:CRISPR-associated protein Cas4 [Rapidithrix thailandica]|uniref:CRISPR-associated exonuclease Cas4 n=1 Tax=Rapidithrix thailandica TaxID=413964 RepID=A0AAW9RWK2_9BACT
MITATHLTYYFVCLRKLWLFDKGIQMEHTSETVYEGKLIHESSYPQRPEKFTEVELPGAKIDFYDAKNKVVHEIKKSDKMEEAHRWQVKYYLYLLQQQGIEGAIGRLEYPKLRKTETVSLEEEDEETLTQTLANIKTLLSQEKCPDRLPKKTFCRSCSYFEFCWTE